MSIPGPCPPAGDRRVLPQLAHAGRNHPAAPPAASGLAAHARHAGRRGIAHALSHQGKAPLTSARQWRRAGRPPGPAMRRHWQLLSCSGVVTIAGTRLGSPRASGPRPRKIAPLPREPARRLRRCHPSACHEIETHGGIYLERERRARPSVRIHRFSSRGTPAPRERSPSVHGSRLRHGGREGERKGFVKPGGDLNARHGVRPDATRQALRRLVARGHVDRQANGQRGRYVVHDRLFRRYLERQA